MKKLIEEKKIDIDSINFLNLDIQGVELRALKGLGEYLKKIDFNKPIYIYSQTTFSLV